MSNPSQLELHGRIAAFVWRAVQGEADARPFPRPENMEMGNLIELTDWADGRRVLFVLDPDPDFHLMRLWEPTPEEEEALGDEIREELDAQARHPKSHRSLILFTFPLDGPGEGQVHLGAIVEETHERDGADLFELAVYPAS